jgi:hypothetical protein
MPCTIIVIPRLILYILPVIKIETVVGIILLNIPRLLKKRKGQEELLKIILKNEEV